MKVKIVICDDHAMMRDGLRKIVEENKDYSVVGEAENGRVAIKMASELLPDIIIMDIQMKGLNGIDATRQIKKANSNIKVIALSMYSDNHLVKSMLSAGASGYIVKSSASDDLLKGIKAVMLKQDLLPVFCVSALQDMGTRRLMGFIDNVCPATSDLIPEQSVEGHLVAPDTDAPTVLFVFKTIHQPNLGQITFFKVKSGEISLNDKLTNSRTGETEVLNQLFIMDGKNRNPIEKLTVGDIGATLKLKFTETNDTLYSGKEVITIKPVQYPEPRIVKTITAVSNKDDEKITDNIAKEQAGNRVEHHCND